MKRIDKILIVKNVKYRKINIANSIAIFIIFLPKT